MVKYGLSEKQRALLRSIISGLADGTVKTEWGILFGDGGISAISGISNELWRNSWNEVKRSDFDAFVRCGYFIPIAQSPTQARFSLMEQAIMDAVENNFENPISVSSSPKGYAPKVFISYKREDATFTQRLTRYLNRVFGEDCVWFDRRLFGGQVWWDEIERQISDRDTFVYLLSREALESVYCRAEFTEAWRLGKRIIPVQIRNGDYPEVLRRLQILSMEYDISADQIVEIIAAIIQEETVNKLTQIQPDSLWDVRKLHPAKASSIRSTLRVPANVEPDESKREMCNTGLLLVPGDELNIWTSGKVTIDKGSSWMDPNGTYPHPENGSPIFYHTSEAYKAVGHPQPEVGQNGVVGSLFGWIGSNSRSIDKAFFVGRKHQRAIQRGEGGFLYLAVNDTKEMYWDNEGYFEVTIELHAS